MGLNLQRMARFCFHTWTPQAEWPKKEACSKATSSSGNPCGRKGDLLVTVTIGCFWTWSTARCPAEGSLALGGGVDAPNDTTTARHMSRGQFHPICQ